MNFFDAIKICFVKYTNFSDRASRSEFWLFLLFNIIVEVAMIIVDFVTIVFFLATIIPYTAVMVRRLHDVNRSGWWYFALFTIIGVIPVIYWLCKKGDEEDNRFGVKPLV